MTVDTQNGQAHMKARKGSLQGSGLQERGSRALYHMFVCYGGASRVRFSITRRQCVCKERVDARKRKGATRGTTRHMPRPPRREESCLRARAQAHLDRDNHAVSRPHTLNTQSETLLEHAQGLLWLFHHLEALSELRPHTHTHTATHTHNDLSHGMGTGISFCISSTLYPALAVRTQQAAGTCKYAHTHRRTCLHLSVLGCAMRCHTPAM